MAKQLPPRGPQPVSRSRSRPPRPARWLLERSVPKGAARDGLRGDLEEMYSQRLAAGRGPRLARRLAADLWFAWEALFAALRYRPWTQRLMHLATGIGAPSRPGPIAAVREVRAALWLLARSPGFSAASVLTLGLAFGATAATFAATWGIIVKPLPFPDADRLVVIEHRLPGYPAENGEVTFGAFQGQVIQYVERSRELVEVGAYGTFDAAITEVDSPEYVRFGYATAGFFRALGIEPAQGRLFHDDELDPANDGHGSAILSEAMARQRYGGEGSAIGTIIETEGFEREVIGVLSAGLAFPPERVKIWNPRPERTLRANPVWTVDALVGRMAPGATVAGVQRELENLVAEIPERFAGSAIESVAADGRMAPLVTPMKEWLIGGVARAMWWLLTSVGVVLAIACVNIATLVMVRTDARRTELAVREALGASRWQLARYFLAESLALCTAAGIVAYAVSVTGIHVLRSIGPADLPRISEVSAGWELVVPIAIMSVLGTVIFAAVPLVSHPRESPQVLRAGPLGKTAGRRQLRLRHLMVGLQLALAVVLLVGSGLVLRSFQALVAVEPGFEADGVLTFRIPFPFKEIQAGGAAEGRATPFFDQLVDRFEALPGVVSAGYGLCVPLAEACSLDGYPVKARDVGDPEDAQQPLAGLQPISPGFLESLRIPLLSGRGLVRADHQQRSNAVLVSAGLAARLWPGEDPLGKRLEQGGGSTTQNHHFTVVGVTGDIRFDRLRDEPEFIVYTPVRFQGRATELWTASFVVRSHVAPGTLVDAIRAQVAALRKDIPVADIDSMEIVVARSTMQIRFVLTLLTLLAAAALALSAVGVYGAVSYVVGLRRREFGIRLALGAEAPQLRSLVLRQGARTLAGGLVVGLTAAAAGSRFLVALLFAVEPTDPTTYALVALFLISATLVAGLVPARRISRVSPLEALR